MNHVTRLMTTICASGPAIVQDRSRPLLSIQNLNLLPARKISNSCVSKRRLLQAQRAHQPNCFGAPTAGGARGNSKEDAAHLRLSSRTILHVNILEHDIEKKISCASCSVKDAKEAIRLLWRVIEACPAKKGGEGQGALLLLVVGKNVYARFACRGRHVFRDLTF